MLKDRWLSQFFKTLLFWYFALAATLVSAQKKGFADGYKIKGTIEGLQDTVCYLANYFGDKTYVTDTAEVDSKGRFTFEGDSALPGGIYIVAGQSNNKYLEIIVDKEQSFSFETSLPELSENISFVHSPQNKLFFEFINYNVMIRKQIEKLKKDQELYKELPDSSQQITQRIEKLNDAIENYENELILNHPESFVTMLIRATKDPEVHDIPFLPNGRQDSVYAFRAYKEHFWDNFDLTDDRLLRTPLFHKRLERYFRDLVYQRPDSINREADSLIRKVRGNREVFKYIVWYLTYKYETSKVMGFDEIFVHMIDTYYSKGEAYWTDSATLKAIRKRADALRPILIGKKAPELILLDTSNSFQSLHHTTAKFLLLLFYESDCSHCRKEIKELKDWYENNEVGAGVFAVCTDTSLVKWKKFINENELHWINVNGTRSITRDYHDLYDINMTPALFVLDERKNIIAKKLKASQVDTFLDDYLKHPEWHVKN